MKKQQVMIDATWQLFSLLGRLVGIKQIDTPFDLSNYGILYNTNAVLLVGGCRAIAVNTGRGGVLARPDANAGRDGPTVGGTFLPTGPWGPPLDVDSPHLDAWLHLIGWGRSKTSA